METAATTLYAFPNQPAIPGLPLWPPHQASRLQPNAFRTATAEYKALGEEYGALGDSIDRGAVRQRADGSFEVAAAGGKWMPLDTGDFGTRIDVLRYYRYGKGSAFPVIDIHGDAKEAYRKLTASNPGRFPPRVDLMDAPDAVGPIDDVLYDGQLWRDVVAAAFPPPAQTDVPPQTTPPVPRPAPAPTPPPQPPAKPTPELLPQPPVTEPAPPPAPVVVAPPPSTLSAESRETMEALRTWMRDGKPLGSHRQRRVAAMLDEVTRLLP